MSPTSFCAPGSLRSRFHRRLRWRTITGVHNYEPRHLTQAAECLAHSHIDWVKVLSPAISLNDTPEAYNTRGDGGSRTLVAL